MYAKYSDYLVLKTVVSKCGTNYLNQLDLIARNEARLTGLKGDTNTNGNLTDLYQTEWEKVYGTNTVIPAIPADIKTDPYKLLQPTSFVALSTGTYALWVAAAAAEKVAKDAWDAADKVWVAQKAAKDLQTGVKDQASAEK